MIYRAAPVTQRDGSALANSNCRMAACACVIDFHTLAAVISTGSEMRERQSDQVGGTDSGDAAEAWSTYGQSLRVMDGHTWTDLIADLMAGRSATLDVWAATTGGPCLSGTGAYAHSLAIAPEQSGTRWLVSDPWCNPPKWTWWEESRLRAGAEKLGNQTHTAATSGHSWPRGERELIRAMVRALRALMTRYTPDRPARDDPPDTGGAEGRIFYTTSRAQGVAPPVEVSDMPINAAEGLVTALRAEVPAGLDFYADPNLSDRLGAMAKTASVVYVGNPVGESVPGGSRAILVNTSHAYSDGSTRPTIVYVAADAIDPVRVPPPDAGPDVDAIVAARDDEWTAWLLEGAPGADA